LPAGVLVSGNGEDKELSIYSISQPAANQYWLLEIANIRRPSEGWEGLAISGHPVRYTI
jgi:hypothetical protein